MTPTPEQTLALNSMKKWLMPGGEPFFCLRGYAGTGKTFSVTELLRRLLADNVLRADQICFTAPTNKAVKVLRNYLHEAGFTGASCRMIYSLLGLSLQPNGEVKELSKPEDPIDLNHLKCVVVDESSMVNKFLFEAIEETSRAFNLPFLFMGDPAQLPPVGEIKSPVWGIEPFSELTKVMRYGDSMLDLATSIRKLVDHPFPSIKIETAPPVFRLSKSEWLEKALDNLPLFQSGEAKMIAWRNITVGKYNALIRATIFGRAEAREKWLPSDKIVATEMLKDLDDNIFMRTDEEATVEKVSISPHPYYREIEVYNLLCLDEYGIKRTIRTPTADGTREMSNQLEDLSHRARAGEKRLWREFWLLKEALHQVRHSYSITSHRSQGSSYKKVWVDLEDILLNRNRQEAFRSLYVSCTRQREELYIA